MLTFEKVYVTPALAEGLLKSNHENNRSLRRPTLEQYCKDIMAGRWREDTGETIKITKSGVVADGQHRLRAIIKTGIAIHLHITRGLDDDVFDVLDTGKSRSSVDIFKIQGAKNETALPSMIMRYILLSAGKNSSKEAYSSSSLYEMYSENKAHWDMVAKHTHNWYVQFAKILPPSQIGGIYAYLCDLSKKQAFNFMSQLATGIDVENNTIILLRNKLIQDKTSFRKMPPDARFSLIIKTWNLYRNKEVKKSLQWHEGEGFIKAI